MLRATAYCAALKNSGQKEFDYLFNQLKLDSKSNVKSDLLIGLSCTKEPYLLQKFLSDRLVNSNDSLTSIRYVITRSPSYIQAWTFMKENWDAIFEK
jgi:aminopeptidase N